MKDYEKIMKIDETIMTQINVWECCIHDHDSDRMITLKRHVTQHDDFIEITGDCDENLDMGKVRFTTNSIEILSTALMLMNDEG